VEGQGLMKVVAAVIAVVVIAVVVVVDMIRRLYLLLSDLAIMVLIEKIE